MSYQRRLQIANTIITWLVVLSLLATPGYNGQRVSAAPAESRQPQAASPSISLSKSDALLVDQDHDGQVTPGDTLRYTLALENSGSADASGVTLVDVLDETLTLVPGSLRSTPLAYAAALFVAEDSSPAGLTLLGADFDGDAITYSIVSSPTHGALDGAAPHLTYSLTQPNYFGSDNFTFSVCDAETPPNCDTAAVDITILPVNDPPSFTSGAAQTVLEDSPAFTLAGWAVDISAGPANESTQSLTFDVSSDNSSLFSVQPAVTAGGTLSFTPAPDQFGTATLSVTLRDNGGTASGGSDTSAAQTLLVDVQPVNDPPAFSTGTDVTVTEDSGAQTLQNWATAITPGPGETGQAVSFQVTGNTNPALFAAGPALAADGTLTFTPAQDATGAAQITLRLSDNGGTANGGADTSASRTFRITVQETNDTPLVDAASFSINENSALGAPVGTVTFTDPDPGQTHTYAITAGDAGSVFAIDPASGLISVARPGLLDFETNPTFDLTVTVTDTGSPAASGSAAVGINLNNVNDAPVVNPAAFSLPENSPTGSVVGSVTASDQEPAQTHIFAITGGNLDGAFAISAGGQLTVASPTALNYETHRIFSLTVQATDNGSPAASDEGMITITLSDVNEAPQVTSTAFSVDEYAPNGTLVGTVTMNDPDLGQTHAFSITAGNGSGAFTINNTGEISVADTTAIDFTVRPTFTLTVQVSDSAVPPLTGSATITILVNDVNDIPLVNAASFSIPENSPASALLGSITYSDRDTGQTHAFSITAGNTAGAFSIHPVTGALTAAGPLDYETLATYTLTIAVTDNGTPAQQGTAQVTISVNNVNEPPAVSPAAFDLPENSPAGAAVGTLAVSDPETGQTHAFAITSGNDDHTFAISALGEISLSATAALDHETQAAYDLQITVTDNGSPAASTIHSLRVNITDVNEAPVIENAAISANENLAAGTLVTTLPVSDPDEGQTHTFTITAGNTNGAFAINTSGQLTAASTAALNFEVNPSFTLTVRVTDSGSPALTGTAQITLNLLNVNEAPVVIGESYQSIGNTLLQVASAGTAPAPRIFVSGHLLANDSDPDAGDLIRVGTATSATGAVVNLAPDGTFTYLPPAGSTSDSFSYTVVDQGGLSTSGTVSIALVGMVWYVKNDAAAGGLGRSTDPFDTLAEAQTASAAGDTIYVYSGDGTTTGQGAGIALKANQRLIGSGVALDLPVAVNGGANPTPLLPAGQQPLIYNTSSGGSGVSITGISAEVRGLNIAGNINAIDATFSGSSSGTLTIANNTIRSAGAEGIDINPASTGSVIASVQDNTISAAGTGFDMSVTGSSAQLDFSRNTISAGITGINILRTSGRLTITGFSNNQVSGDLTGNGVVISSVLFDSTPGGALDQVNLVSLHVGASGNPVGSSGLQISTSEGNLLFPNLEIYSQNGTGLQVSGASPTSYGGMSVTINDGQGIVNTTGAAALALTSLAINALNLSVTNSGSTTGGVSLTTVAGSLSTTTGSVISASNGTGFLVNGGNAALTYNGSISMSSGRVVEISDRTGGSISFTGPVSASSGTGVYLHDNNVASSVSFSGGLVLSTTTNTAFHANNGGSLSVTGSANTLTTTTGSALLVRSSTITASGLTFRSISTGAANPAVELNTTGSLGGLTVAGTGSAGTGGTITNPPNDAIRLINTRSISLNYMNINGAASSSSGASCGSESAVDCAAAVDMNNASGVTLNQMTLSGSGKLVTAGSSVSGQMGISGYQVNGLTVTNTTVSNTGDSNDEYALLLHNPSGVILLQDSTFTGMVETGFRLFKDSGAVLNLTMRRATFSSNNTTVGEDGFQFKLAGASAANMLVDRSIFTSLQRDAIDGIYQDSATLNLTVTNNTLERNYGGGGIVIGGNGSASGYLDLSGNTIQNNASTAISLTSAGTARLDAKLESNIIRHPAPVAPQVGEGIRLAQEENSVMTVLLNSNQVSGVSLRDVAAYARLAAASGALKIVATNNTAGVPLTTPSFGMDFNVQDAGHTICLDISGNSAAGNNAPGIRARNTAGTFQLAGAAIGLLNAADAAAFINGRNTSNLAASASLGTGMTFTGVASGSCGTPTVPTQPSAALQQESRLASTTRRAPGLASLVAPALLAAGETVQVVVGTLPAGKSVTVTFDVLISTALPVGVYQVANQAAVTGSNFADVLSDDPATPLATGDPTLTDLYRTPTSNDDLYITDEDTSLTVAAPGVLENDLVTPGHTMSAVQDTLPTAGTLSLAGNGGLTYTPAANEHGDRTFTYHTEDGSSSSTPALVTLRILPINDAPVLDPTGSMSLNPVNTVDGLSSGTLVSDLLASAGSRISDVDSGALEGIAVIGADASHGHWQYSTTGGLAWDNLGLAAPTAARLLSADADSRLRFIAEGGFAGTIDPAVTFYAWDRSAGANGGTADVTTRGGATPFSITAETASLVIEPAADLALTLTASDSTPLAGTQVNFTLSAANSGPNPAQSVAITALLPAGFSLAAPGAGCSTMGSSVTCTQTTLASGAAASFNLNVQVSTEAVGAFTTSAAVTSQTFDPNLADNAASVSVTSSRESEVVSPDDPLDPTKWSDTTITQPTCGSAFIGEFSNETVNLALADLPQHSTVTIEFDLVILRSWDGNETGDALTPGAAEFFAAMGASVVGPDVWSLSLDQKPLLVTTFSNWDTSGFRQAYPGAYPGGSYPARTGASTVNSMCYNFFGHSQDTTYHMVYTVPHDQANLTLGFSAAGLQSIDDESWGLDNVSVRLSSGADLKPYRIFLPQVVR